MKIRTILAAAVMAAVSFAANAETKAEKEEILKNCVSNPSKPASNSVNPYKPESCQTVCMTASSSCLKMLILNDCVDKNAPHSCSFPSTIK